MPELVRLLLNIAYVIRVPPEMTSAYEAIAWINWGIAPETFAIET